VVTERREEIQVLRGGRKEKLFTKSKNPKPRDDFAMERRRSKREEPKNPTEKTVDE